MPIRADAARTRLMVRIARMYHELGKRQTEIAAELHVSQPRVSRLLKRAVEEGIVRTVVTAPEGTHLGLEGWRSASGSPSASSSTPGGRTRRSMRR